MVVDKTKYFNPDLLKNLAVFGETIRHDRGNHTAKDIQYQHYCTGNQAGQQKMMQAIKIGSAKHKEIHGNSYRWYYQQANQPFFTAIIKRFHIY